MNRKLSILMTFVLAFTVLFVATKVQATNNVCFCHNVNNNPHTICTSNQGQINGHNNHVNNGEDTQGQCTVQVSSSPSATPVVSASPTSTVSATQTSTPISEETWTPTPTPTDQVTVQVACNHHCTNDSECQALDRSYRCTPEHVCRLEEAPERASCDPRPNNCTSNNPEGCAEQMREAGFTPQGPMK